MGVNEICSHCRYFHCDEYRHQDIDCFYDELSCEKHPNKHVEYLSVSCEDFKEVKDIDKPV